MHEPDFTQHVLPLWQLRDRLENKLIDDINNHNTSVTASNAKIDAYHAALGEIRAKSNAALSVLKTRKASCVQEKTRVNALKSELKQHKLKLPILQCEHEELSDEPMKLMTQLLAAENLLKDKTRLLDKSQQTLVEQASTASLLQLNREELEMKILNLAKTFEQNTDESKMSRQARHYEQEREHFVKLFNQSQQTVAALKKSLEESSLGDTDHNS